MIIVYDEEKDDEEGPYNNSKDTDNAFQDFGQHTGLRCILCHPIPTSCDLCKHHPFDDTDWDGCNSTNQNYNSHNIWKKSNSGGPNLPRNSIHNKIKEQANRLPFLWCTEQFLSDVYWTRIRSKIALQIYMEVCMNGWANYTTVSNSETSNWPCPWELTTIALSWTRKSR